MTKTAAPLLALGAGGVVGRHLRAVWPESVPVRWHSRKAQQGFEHCDLLAEPKRLDQLVQGCAAIVCLAGVTERYHREVGAAYEENSRLAQAAIVAAHNGKCPRVLLSSSAAVYGQKSGFFRKMIWAPDCPDTVRPNWKWRKSEQRLLGQLASKSAA